MNIREIIDGPTDPTFEIFSRNALAESFVKGVAYFGNWMDSNDPDESKPQGYRIASLVEDESYMDGYALSLSRANHIPVSGGKFNVRALYHVVNRDSKTAEELPKELFVPGPVIEDDIESDFHISQACQEAATTFDRDELRRCIAMMSKIVVSLYTRDYRSPMDGFVRHAMMTNYVDRLSSYFPGRPANGDEITGYSDAVLSGQQHQQSPLAT